MNASLDRRIGLLGSSAVGVSAMIGAGLFVVFAPAVRAAGDGVLVALVVAAVIAVFNAISSARLARLYPVSGGTYVYGRERLGPFWGHLAGWSFIVGKLASCAVMALAVGAYAWPDQQRPVALAVIVVVTVINLGGVQKSVAAGIVIVAVVLAIVLVAVALMARAPAAISSDVPTSPGGVLQAAALLFFAFAGYARLATLGEEVRRPERTIPQAVAIAVVLVVVVYAAAGLALLHVLGADRLGASTRPFTTGLDAAGGALLSLVLGVSRTTLAMARDGHLPGQLAHVNARSGVPDVAEIAVGAVVGVLVLLGDLATSVAFSSFCVLVYYAIANASALTLPSGLPARVGAMLGLGGCVLLATSLPLSTVLWGGIVVAAGALSYGVRRGRDAPDSQST